MKKVLIIISMILVSAVMAAAQTGANDRNIARRDHAAERKASVRKERPRAPGVVRVGPSTTYLKRGLKAADVVRFLGWPVSGSERRSGDSRLATYTFARGEGRVLVAEFENDLLVSFHTEPSTALVENKTEVRGQ